MGIRENLIVDWKDKTIEYFDKKMYVIEQFTYKGIEYLYVVDKATINNENLEVAFLYRVKDDIFANVDSDELFNELLDEVAKKNLEEITEMAINKIKNNQ
ncbi:MAG: hypothetical protein IKF52_03325 [Clostridia bacterium]|nr:hypothetical protein [Clostridia bacterium]